MDALGTYSYDTVVELKKEFYYEKKLRRWLGSFSYGDRAFIRQLLGDATAPLRTHLIGICWRSSPLVRTLL